MCDRGPYSTGHAHSGDRTMTVSRRDAVFSTLTLTAAAMLPDKAAAMAPEVPSPAQASAPSALLSLDDYEQAAREKIPAVNWEYIEGGAADEITVRWNRDAYRMLRLLP